MSLSYSVSLYPVIQDLNVIHMKCFHFYFVWIRRSHADKQYLTNWWLLCITATSTYISSQAKPFYFCSQNKMSHEQWKYVWILLNGNIFLSQIGVSKSKCIICVIHPKLPKSWRIVRRPCSSPNGYLNLNGAFWKNWNCLKFSLCVN